MEARRLYEFAKAEKEKKKAEKEREKAERLMVFVNVSIVKMNCSVVRYTKPQASSCFSQCSHPLRFVCCYGRSCH